MSDKKLQVVSYEDGERKVHATLALGDKRRAAQVAAGIAGAKVIETVTEAPVQEVQEQ